MPERAEETGRAPSPRRSRSAARRSHGPDASAISDFIQKELRRRRANDVTAVEVGTWLDRAGVLRDSPHRPGLPLRNLLRAGRIKGQRQEPNGRWFIDRVDE